MSSMMKNGQAPSISDATSRRRPSTLAEPEGPVSRPRRIHIHKSLARTVDWELYDRKAEREARRYTDEEVPVSLSTRNALVLHGTLASPLLSPASSTASDDSSSSRASTFTAATTPGLSKA
ncbi:hypothetical protein PG996_005927 [Apiospora saccharicola]|uniref:Uncharacterized protein n=1 Tax=Apiospora saccharicola TaxID=335842 RepID=A0ABR1VMU7_9PEZI